ncbi:hypothetical protein D5078_08505 [Pectobacterium carotovorum]|nr:hypothetical protein D5078_08505 [Pectobacterium carotovorum]
MPRRTKRQRRFEQHLCWPEGRAPFMGRVNASLAARLAVMNADGTAQRHNSRHQSQRSRSCGG